MDEVISIILKIVVGIVLAIFTRYLIPYFKTLREDARWQRLINIVEVAVDAAEQVFKGTGQGPIKKEDVLNFVSNWLNEQKIEVSPEELDRLIEAAVKRMNDNKNQVPNSVINVR